MLSQVQTESEGQQGHVTATPVLTHFNDTV